MLSFEIVFESLENPPLLLYREAEKFSFPLGGGDVSPIRSWGGVKLGYETFIFLSQKKIFYLGKNY